MRYKVGQLVVNPKLGVGKVMEVRGENVTVYFRDVKDNPRIINVGVVPMTLAKEQSDPALDAARVRGKRVKTTRPARRTKADLPASGVI